jgi:hypothetical protein
LDEWPAENELGKKGVLDALTYDSYGNILTETNEKTGIAHISRWPGVNHAVVFVRPILGE